MDFTWPWPLELLELWKARGGHVNKYLRKDHATLRNKILGLFLPASVCAVVSRAAQRRFCVGSHTFWAVGPKKGKLLACHHPIHKNNKTLFLPINLVTHVESLSCLVAITSIETGRSSFPTSPISKNSRSLHLAISRPVPKKIEG